MRRTLWAAAFAATIGLGVSAGVVYSQDGGGGEQPAAGGEGGGEMGGMSAEEAAAWAAYGKPGPQHERMAAMAGTWDVAGKMWMKEGASPIPTQGTATFKMVLDGHIQVQEYHGEMMNQPFEGMGLSGYDNGTHLYFGTWADSMSTGMMTHRGSEDASGNVSTTGEWTDERGRLHRMRSVETRSGADSFKLEMYCAGAGCPTEFKMMELVYTRRK